MSSDAQDRNGEQGPYYVIPSERLQELLERASDGEKVADLMVEQYEAGTKEPDKETCPKCGEDVEDMGAHFKEHIENEQAPAKAWEEQNRRSEDD